MSAGRIADPARLPAVRATGRYGAAPDEAFERVARLLARVLAVPATAVTLAGDAAHYLQGAQGLPEPWATAREVPHELALCTDVVESGETLAIADARRDCRSSGHPGLDAFAIGAYLGAPLRADGHVVGTLCAFDRAPRAWTADDVAALHELAACIDSELALRAAVRARDETAERHRAIVETAVDGIVTIDEGGLITSFNAAAERLFGYRADEVIGRSVGMLMPPATRDAHDADLRRYREGGPPHIIGIGREVLAQRRDGTAFSAQLSVGEMTVGGRRMFTGVIHDTSARRRAEESTRAVLAEQAALRRVAEAVAERRATPEIFALTVSEVAALLGAEACGMLRFDGNEAIVVGWHAVDATAPIAVGTRMPASDLAISQAVRVSGASTRQGAAPALRDAPSAPAFAEQVRRRSSSAAASGARSSSPRPTPVAFRPTRKRTSSGSRASSGSRSTRPSRTTRCSCARCRAR